MKSAQELFEMLLDLSFAEDIGDGDHTTLSTIPADVQGEARLLVKEEGILSGVERGIAVLKKLDSSIEVEVLIGDGAHVRPGDVAFIARGPQRSLLTAERTMLNIMQRMSGIATVTARYQKELEGTKARVLDTRKTTPGMRILEKEAVACGGGANHRMGLYDMILIKDNHIDFAGGIEKAIDRARAYCKECDKDLKIEVETRSLDDVRRVLEHGGADRVMFDNFTPELTRRAVDLVAGRLETESSGGITLDNIRHYGLAGVDFVSVGAITHSVKGLDLSFKAIKKD